MRNIKVHKDFGEKGMPAYSVQLKYNEANNYSLTNVLDNALRISWEDSVKNAKGKLESDELLNFVNVSQSPIIVHFGKTSFRDYNEVRQFLDGKKKPETFGITLEDLENLKKQVHPISSFPAIFTKNDEYFLMSKKGWDVSAPGAGKISFPGAGYSNFEKDTSVIKGIRSVYELPNIVEREIREETGILDSEIEKIDTLGVFEDANKGSHRNPGIFTATHTNLTKDEIKKRKNIAADKWEHIGPYVFVPADDPDLMSAFIDSDTEHGGKTLPDRYSSKIEGLAGKNQLETTVKSGYMLLLLGRQLYGSNWYKEALDKHKKHIEIW